MTNPLPEPHWEPRPSAPRDAPNVLIVLLDDTGFAQLGCYGSDIDTPNFDRLAAGGLQFTNFHTTALCSPSRASLLSGRNHHAVGMRHLSNVDTGYANCRGVITPKAATIAEVLASNGYNTFAIGKWHLANMEDCTPAGPHDHWPLQRGFNRFYGFLGGATDQFSPELVVDNHHLDPPNDPEYHVTEDLVDQAITMIASQKTAAPDKPFFTYLALGATHSPHQAPAAYVEKYRGRYDDGWDVVRQRWFEKQIEMGIVPADTELSPRNPGVQAWADHTDDERRLFARFQEAFAGFLDHTDVHVGRLLTYLEQTGEMDNTLVVLASDNGASREGGSNGVLNELAFFNRLRTTTEEMLEHVDDIGGPNLFNNYPLGWAQVGNTPLRHYKGMTYEGGIRDPLIMYWPDGIKNPGLRDQYHHLIDVAPTIYDIIGIDAPTTFRGIEQMPMHGTSMRYLFDAADEPTRRSAQHYEMSGHRAIWADGWKAVALHRKGQPYDDDEWALYHSDADFSEVNNLAAEQPQRLADLKQRWQQEAEQHNVLPLDDRGVELWVLKRPDYPGARSHHRFTPGVPHIDRFNMPDVRNRSFTITAQVDYDDGDSGVLVASGARTGGHVLYVHDGHLVFEYSRIGYEQYVRSDRPLTAGVVELGVLYAKGGEHHGTATLVADGEPVGSGPIETLPFRQTLYGMDIGKDTGPTVSAAYSGEFPYSSKLFSVEYTLGDDRDDLRAAAEAEFDAAMAEQ